MTATTETFVIIAVKDAMGRKVRHRLEEGTSVMLGSGSNCGVKLDDPSVSSIHCVLRLNDGALVLQDWCSTAGTYVDGSKIEDEVTVAPSSAVTIANFEIRFENGSEGEFEPPSASSCERSVPTEDEPVEVEDSTETKVDESSEVETAGAEPSVDESEDLAATCAAERKLEAVEPSVAPPEKKRRVQPTQPRANRPQTLPDAAVDPEMVELMRAELECLQSELADRDRQLADLNDLVDADSGVSADLPDASETEALVGRLEDLLNELASSDQRIQALEELLRAEQDVVRSQEDEKQQIELWIGDIEKRLTAQEEEWQAERKVLESRVSQLQAERDEADLRVQNVDNGSDVQEEAIQAIRAELDNAHQKLDAGEKKQRELESELEKARQMSSAESTKEYVEQAIRDERLALSQERAALSRERAELARSANNSVASGETGQRRMNEADARFNAFRQTLKELHQKEKESKTPTAAKPSLGQRVAELWKRLDGPTDTD